MKPLAEKVAAMLAEGKTGREVAAALGISESWCRQICRRNGIVMDRAAWRVARIKEMAKAGHTRQQMADAIGFSVHGVNHICERHRIYTKQIKPLVNTLPLVQQLVEVMNEQQASGADVERRAGLCRSTVGNWRRRVMPRLDLFVAAANALGYEVVLREAKE